MANLFVNFLCGQLVPAEWHMVHAIAAPCYTELWANDKLKNLHLRKHKLHKERYC